MKEIRLSRTQPRDRYTCVHSNNYFFLKKEFHIYTYSSVSETAALIISKNLLQVFKLFKLITILIIQIQLQRYLCLILSFLLFQEHRIKNPVYKRLQLKSSTCLKVLRKLPKYQFLSHTKHLSPKLEVNQARAPGNSSSESTISPPNLEIYFCFITIYLHSQLTLQISLTSGITASVNQLPYQWL